MAALEQLEIHSKSYLVRWINVSGGHTISWSIQPHKKSINFGIFKHLGAGNDHTPSLPAATPSGEHSPAREDGAVSRPRSMSRNYNTRVVEKLQSIGMKSVAWTGKCEAEKVTMGIYDVPNGEGAMYGLVFDNTFSKQVSKTATFVLMTYPTDAPPKSGHHLRYSETSSASSGSLAAKQSPSLAPLSHSTDSLAPESGGLKSVMTDSRPRTGHGIADSSTVGRLTFYTGVLQKKRRKKNQGHARRFFSLDFTTSTLSYYKDRHSSALRGAIPLSLAVIATNEKTRVFSVDSGAEVWQLRASNQRDFEGWREALNTASETANTPLTPALDRSISAKSASTAPPPSAADSREWSRIENLVGRVSGSRDAVRRLAQDTDPKFFPALAGLGINKISTTSTPSPSETESLDYFGEERQGRASFWKRKTSNPGSSPSGLFRRSVSAQLAVPSPSTVPSNSHNGPPNIPRKKSSQTLRSQQTQRERTGSHPDDEDVHNRCMEALRDLDAVVSEFSALLAESRQRRTLTLSRADTRKSMESTMSEDEFFDATDGDTSRSQLLTIRPDSDEDEDNKSDYVSDAGSESSGDEGIGIIDRQIRGGRSTVLPSKPKSLSPLPLEKVRRRTAVSTPKVAPPSLTSFLRKNVGKDLSTIAMPVSANEPTSLLQRVAEQMEYSELLDAAVQAPADSGERILLVAAFAISQFSQSRIKERAIRKPFNPMLAETYELVREDKGFRFVAEKISHRPVRMACQAEGRDWTFLQSPMPAQKFWGKSAELNTDGRARLLLHVPPSSSSSTPELYSWTVATSFLRNVIAGEKYVEPVGSMTVLCETTGAKAVATFKQAGMFAGRSEEVSVQVFPSGGGTSPLPLGLAGRWTTSLSFTTADGSASSRPPVWNAGQLADPNHPARCYGFTAFAAQLNEVTDVEQGALPPTDSRLRPDQRAVEEGDLDRAEGTKAWLEERQRARRKVMEDHGDTWSPRWFVKAEGGDAGDGEAVWRLKTGREGYWEERARGDWTGVVDVFKG